MKAEPFFGVFFNRCKRFAAIVLDDVAWGKGPKLYTSSVGIVCRFAGFVQVSSTNKQK